MTIKRIAPPPDSLRGHTAGFVTRYVAFLIDVGVIVGVSFLTITMTRVTFNFFGLDRIYEMLTADLDIGMRKVLLSSTARWLVSLTAGFLTFGVYSVLSWLLVGKTVGKALMGLRVLGQDGRPVTVRQAIIRAVSYYLSGLALFIGFLWVLVDDRRQTWHDKLAKTIVVYEWDARYEERLVAAVKVLDASNQRRQAALEDAVRRAVERDEVTVVANDSDNPAR